VPEAQPGKSPVDYWFGPYDFDGRLRRLFKDGEPVALTTKAIDTLAALLERAGRGRHHLRFGGEALRFLVHETWVSGYPGNVLHVLQSGRPSSVFLFEAPSSSDAGVWTAKAHGTVEGPWQQRITSVLRHQAGQPFGRTQTTDAGQLRGSSSTSSTASTRIRNRTRFGHPERRSCGRWRSSLPASRGPA
jgi:hypothetical protein